MGHGTRDYNSIKWSDIFNLDKDSPSGITRKHSLYKTNTFKAGSVAGSKNYQSNGEPISWMVRFNKSKYLVHRIIWVMLYGSIDRELYIDHLDGNPFNNSYDNLSIKTHRGNCQNRKARSDNLSNFTGVHLHTTMNSYKSWRAIWTENDKQYSKTFSVLKYGDEIAKELAICYRKEQISRLNSAGMDYSNRNILQIGKD